MIWNNGLRPAERGGFSASTIRSKGTSWCSYAARLVSRTRASRSRKVGSPAVSMRMTRVFAKKPINPSSASSARPATGVPSGMSTPAPDRVSTAAMAACATMARVVPVTRASSAIRSCRSDPRSRTNASPRPELAAGRGRSVG